MTGATWNQVTAFRLSRHHLSERASTDALPSVVGDMAGAQAQVLSAAQTALWARVRDLRLNDVETAIWEDHILAKAWCMRRTMYLLPSRDVAVFVRGSSRRAEREIQWMRRKGVSERALEDLLDAVLTALDHPVTRTELAIRVSKALGTRLLSRRGGGWGSRNKVACVKIGKVTCPAGYLLHLAGARGVICSGPSRRNEATFVRADVWLPRWKDIPVERAENELLHRYLRAFGPSTPSDFAWWTGMRLSDAREIWSHNEPELTQVKIDGWNAWVLKRDLPELETAVIDRREVHVLPYFDSFLLGHKERQHLVGARNRRRVYRAQGWIAPVVLVNGRVAGVWAHSRKGERLNIHIELFAPVPRKVSDKMQLEMVDLGRFLGCNAVETVIA